MNNLNRNVWKYGELADVSSISFTVHRKSLKKLLLFLIHTTIFPYYKKYTKYSENPNLSKFLCDMITIHMKFRRM